MFPYSTILIKFSLSVSTSANIKVKTIKINPYKFGCDLMSYACNIHKCNFHKIAMIWNTVYQALKLFKVLSVAFSS